MRTEKQLFNRNVLKCAQIVGTNPNSVILDIEGVSIKNEVLFY